MSEENFDLAIVGGGAAGFSAAIYGGRSGLSTVLLEKSMFGGQTITSPMIENYPGFLSASGPDLMEKFREHAQKYAVLKEWTDVTSIRKEADHFILEAGDDVYTCKGVVLATGAVHRKLGFVGEGEFSGRGVSYCATCDGFFFKGKKVLVVGGGNTALTEAIYLLSMGCSVTLIHRRDQLRGEKALEDLFVEKGGTILWSTVVESASGEDSISSVVLRNVKYNSMTNLEVAGIFVAVGITPNNSLAATLGMDMNEEGYILVDRDQRTNIPGVYAAGDNCIGLRQVVTGAAEGAVAAVTAHGDITNRPWGQ